MEMASLNVYMHPRNIYKKPLNFVELCNQFPELQKYTTQVYINLDDKVVFLLITVIKNHFVF